MATEIMAKGAWADLAQPGATLSLHVTPNARHNTLTREVDALRCTVTSTPEDGQTNHAVTVLLAHALGVPPRRLVLVLGAASRDKVFRLD